MRRVKLVVSYDGRAYRGSQIQPRVATIQETLESALRKIRAYAGRTTFAGRTDAGVHALGQVVSCDVEWARGPRELGHALNSVLPSDICVMRCEKAADTFNARFDALSREYRYRVAEARRLSPLNGRYIWAQADPLDQARAEQACATLRGCHGFGSFASAGFSQQREAAALTRDVMCCEWHRVGGTLFPAPDCRDVSELRIRANGFLPQMVRNITRAVVEVASGKQSPEWIEYLLVSGDRRLLGPPAPPHGLVLWNVEYADDMDASIEYEG